MNDVMSITKAALGLVYAAENVDVQLPFWPAWKRDDITINHVLHHNAGMHDDSGKHTFDYWAFRRHAPGDVTGYAEKLLKKRRPSPGVFGYSNLAWQLLAARFHEVTGISPAASLAKLLGTDGWTWETDATGTCLGPHGLEMNKKAATLMGAMAHCYFTREDFHAQTPRWFWASGDFPQDRYVHNGWFAYKTPKYVLYACGFLEQYIAVCDGMVHTQLRGRRKEQFDIKSVTPREAGFMKRIVYG